MCVYMCLCMCVCVCACVISRAISPYTRDLDFFPVVSVRGQETHFCTIILSVAVGGAINCHRHSFARGLGRGLGWGNAGTLVWWGRAGTLI